MKVISLIPARYESTRFPGKMLADLCGKPVIVRTYESVVATGLFDEVYVVTDHEKIEEAVVKHGGKALRSIKEHETGSDRISEMVASIDCDVVVNVQGDEPFVTAGPLKQLVDAFYAPDADNIDLVSMVQKITDRKLIFDPNYVKVVMDKNRYALYFSRSPIPYPRENEMEKVNYYEHVGVYAFRRQSLLDFAVDAMLQNEQIERVECLRYLEYGKRIKMVEAPFVSMEIDTPEDLVNACALFKTMYGADCK